MSHTEPPCLKCGVSHLGNCVGYMQIVEQTDEEKLKMYMKCKKKELAEMLINANKVMGLAGVPKLIIEHPDFINGMPITQAGFGWAKEELETL